MRTVTISPADEVELKLLRDQIERHAENERRAMDAKIGRAFGGGRFSDAERDDRKWLELIDRLLADRKPTPCGSAAADEMLIRIVSRGLLPCEHNVVLFQYADGSGFGAAIEGALKGFDCEATGETPSDALANLIRMTNRGADFPAKG